MSAHTYTRRVALSGMVMGLLCLLAPESTFAQAAAVLNDPFSGISSVVSIIISVMNLGIWMLFVCLNFLLDPTFIFNLRGTGADEGAFMQMLNEIWQLSRDLMNVMFAVTLVGGALYTIILSKKELLSEHAPKFVIAVVLVNFSWFFPRVIIDISNVAAATVYGIPSLIGNDAQCTVDGEPCKVVANVDFFLDKERFQQLSSETSRNQGWTCPGGDLLCVQTQTLNADTIAGHSAILNGLIINHGRLQSLIKVPEVGAGNNAVSNMLSFIIRQALIIGLHAAMLFPLMAMVAAFAIRIPVLWITIAFMPFIFLNMVVPDKFSFAKEYSQKIWDYFLKAAFLPALVAVPLAVGYILINAGAGLPMPELQGLHIRLLDNVQNFWQLLWMIISFGVLWTGVFAALSKIEFVAGISNSIKQYGTSLGKLALKTPLAIPLPIGPGGKDVTPLSLSRSFNPRALDAAISNGASIGEALESARSGRGNEQLEINNSAQDIFRNKREIDLTNRIKDLTDAITRGSATKKLDTIKRIEAEFKIEIDRSNPLASLERLRDAVSRTDSANVEPINKAIEELKKATDAANPPAAPAPAPATPPAPPAAPPPPTT